MGGKNSRLKQQMKNINCKTYYRSEMHRISFKIMQGLHKSAEMKTKEIAILAKHKI